MTRLLSKASRIAPALALALLLSSCGGHPQSDTISETRRVRIEVQWQEDVGAMAQLHQLALTNDEQRICTVSQRGVASFLNTDSGEREELPLQLPINGGDVYLAGAGCEGDIVTAVSRDGWLRVYDAVDGFLWQENLKTRVYGAPLIGQGKLFVLGLDGRLLAFTLKRGRELWRYVSPLENLVRTPLDSSLTMDGDVVYGGIDNGAVVALSQSDGKVLWENTISVPSNNNAIANILDATTPAVANGVICASAYQYGVACFEEKRGERLWHYALPAHTRVAFDDAGKRLFATDIDGVLYAFSAADGELLWRVKTGITLSAPLFIGGMIVVADEFGRLFVFFSDNGEVGASIELGTDKVIHMRALSAPARELITLSEDGALHRLRIAF